MIRQFDPAFWFGGQLLDRSVVKMAKADVELLQSYIGTWKGSSDLKGRFRGKDGGKVSCTLSLSKGNGDKVLRSERYQGSISRTFSLASDVDEAKVDARYADGVLTLTLPKKATEGARTNAIQ